jgi:hypothetical protein
METGIVLTVRIKTLATGQPPDATMNASLGYRIAHLGFPETKHVTRPFNPLTLPMERPSVGVGVGEKTRSPTLKLIMECHTDGVCGRGTMMTSMKIEAMAATI